MDLHIFTLKFDINRCYIIRTLNGTIMVDGGPPGRGKSFLNQLSKNNINPTEIKLIVITHGDFDHIGSAKEFKKLTGAKIAMHKNDLDNLEEGKMNWPNAITLWGKISRFLLKPLIGNIKIQKSRADIILDDQDFSLGEFGIDGKIVFTPGHSPGSVSILLNTGEAFAGCMAQNGFPFTRKPAFPIYADDLEKLKESWKVLIEKGAKMIYPGHGKPFHIDLIKKYL